MRHLYISILLSMAYVSYRICCIKSHYFSIVFWFMWREKFSLLPISVSRKLHSVLDSMKSFKRDTWLLLWLLFLLEYIIIYVLLVFIVNLLAMLQFPIFSNSPLKLKITFSKLEPDSDKVGSSASMMGRKL